MAICVRGRFYVIKLLFFYGYFAVYLMYEEVGVMHKFIHRVTDAVASRRGVWVTLCIWLVVIIGLSVFAPGSKDYSVNSVSQLYPKTSPSEIAKERVDTYFAGEDGLPGVIVFEADGDVETSEVTQFTAAVGEADVAYMKSIVPLERLPEAALETFISDDSSALFLPILFDAGMTSKEINVALDEIVPLAEEYVGATFYLTGPAGIAVDATALFSRADLVLLFSTVGIILLLLIVTYRSPLLALIPLFGAVFVYAVVDRLLGLVGASGVELANQSLSIMMILLFAVVIDYSLFVFSRFREELKKTADKYEAMRLAMREIGIPIFYSGSTIFLAMIVLLFASFGDYRNFAPIFTVAVFVVMVAGITLIPALFTIFGRRSFWPKVPRVGEDAEAASTLWSRVGRFVATKPKVGAATVLALLVVCGALIFQLTYEYNTLKSFPEDMPSREGYHILEEKFEPGMLAPTTVLFEAKNAITEEDSNALITLLEERELVQSVRLDSMTDDERVAQYELVFASDPYGVEAMDILKGLVADSDAIVHDAGISGDIYFAGETAASVDNRSVNVRDLIVIVIIETILIFTMLIFLTRSVTISAIMMGTILISFVAALGLGNVLSGWIFGVDAISNRVPVYAFVFLVALGIDYNIFLVSRFLEEKKRMLVHDAIQTSVAKTGGVISSAGIILAATFAVLITQPIQDLMIFGFIVALGILMDTFLIRGALLPSLLALIEKNNPPRILRRK